MTDMSTSTLHSTYYDEDFDDSEEKIEVFRPEEGRLCVPPPAQAPKGDCANASADVDPETKDKTAPACEAQMQQLLSTSQELLERMPSYASESLLESIASSELPIDPEMKWLLSPQNSNVSPAHTSEPAPAREEAVDGGKMRDREENIQSAARMNEELACKEEQDSRAQRNMEHAREREEEGLKSKLVQFYAALKVDKTHEIQKIAQDYRGKETELNFALRAKYGKDLETCRINSVASGSTSQMSMSDTHVQSASPNPHSTSPHIVTIVRHHGSHARPSSALGLRPHTGGKSALSVRPRSAPPSRERRDNDRRLQNGNLMIDETLDSEGDGTLESEGDVDEAAFKSYRDDIQYSRLVSQRAGRAIIQAHAALNYSRDMPPFTRISDKRHTWRDFISDDSAEEVEVGAQEDWSRRRGDSFDRGRGKTGGAKWWKRMSSAAEALYVQDTDIQRGSVAAYTDYRQVSPTGQYVPRAANMLRLDKKTPNGPNRHCMRQLSSSASKSADTRPTWTTSITWTSLGNSEGGSAEVGRGLYFSPEKELECLARLLHLPPRRTGQSLDTYAHDLRVAAEHGIGNYRRTLTLPHPKKRESQIPILDSLFTNTGYPQRPVSRSRRISGETSGPNSRARYSGAPPPTTSYDGVAPTNSISGKFELNLGRKAPADPEAVMSEWAQKFKDISAKIDAKVEEARQVNTRTRTDQVWYKPGDKGPDGLALWVPKDAREKSLRPKSSLRLLRRRPASACSTSRQSLQIRRMAFLSSEVRFPQGFLLDEQRYVLGIQRLDVAPKIPQSSFGKQATSQMRSPPSITFSKVPRPQPHHFSGLEILHSAPEITAVPRVYNKRSDMRSDLVKPLKFFENSTDRDRGHIINSSSC